MQLYHATLVENGVKDYPFTSLEAGCNLMIFLSLVSIVPLSPVLAQPQDMATEEQKRMQDLASAIFRVSKN